MVYNPPIDEPKITQIAQLTKLERYTAIGSYAFTPATILELIRLARLGLCAGFIGIGDIMEGLAKELENNSPLEETLKEHETRLASRYG